jgi:hypothetical protein
MQPGGLHQVYVMILYDVALEVAGEDKEMVSIIEER